MAKRRKKANKGGNFERKLCIMFSEWWTDGKRDDIFWRTDSSGGRAKRRSRAGKQTYGKHGDLFATDPIGQPLIDLITLELKVGYPKHSISELFDRLGDCEFDKWHAQVTESMKAAESKFWAIIWLRNTKGRPGRIMIYFPMGLYQTLKSVGCFKTIPNPSIRIRCPLENIFGTSLERFFEEVKSEHIKKLLRIL